MKKIEDGDLIQLSWLKKQLPKTLPKILPAFDSFDNAVFKCSQVQ